MLSRNNDYIFKPSIYIYIYTHLVSEMLSKCFQGTMITMITFLNQEHTRTHAGAGARARVCVCERARARACLCVCAWSFVRARVCSCVSMFVCAFADFYDFHALVVARLRSVFHLRAVSLDLSYPSR